MVRAEAIKAIETVVVIDVSNGKGIDLQRAIQYTKLR